MKKLRFATRKSSIIASGFAALIGLSAQAQTLQFQPGKLAVLRAGDGNVALAGKQAPMFVDQIDPNSNNAAPSFTLTIPTNGATPLFINGQAATEGSMTRAADRTVLTFAGYSTNLTPFGGTPSGLGVDRGFCTMDAFGNYNLVYKGGGWYGISGGKTNPRGITTDGTNNFWGCGNAFGTLYYNPTVSSQPLQFESLTSTRAIRVINNVLYASINGADGTTLYPAGIYNFVDFFNNPVALPQGSASFMNLVIPATAPYVNNVDFSINPAGTIAYAADTSLGIQKYVKSGGSWRLAYNFSIPQNIPTNLNNGNGCFALAVDFGGANPIIYATTTEGFGGNFNSNRVVRIVDTNASATVDTILQATNVNMAYRGLDFTPDLRPIITSNPDGQSVVVGGSANFSVTASSVYPPGYQWLGGGSALMDQTNSTLTLNSLSLASDGSTYLCVVTNAYGAVTSAPALLTVTPVAVAPSIAGPVQNLTNSLGDNIAITISASGTDPLTYQWYQNGNPLADAGEFSGTTTRTLNINNAQQTDAATNSGFSVVVGNTAGSQSNLVATLTLVFPQPVIIVQPVSTTTFSNGNASFSVIGYGDNLIYKWYRGTNATNLTALSDAGDFSGTATSTLTITGAQNADATNGSFFVLLNNTGGAVTSAPATLSLIVAPPHSFVAYTSSGQVYSQNFDSLPIPNGNNFNTANPQTMSVITNVPLGKGSTFTYSLDNPYDFTFPIAGSGNVGGLGLGTAMAGWYGWSALQSKVGASGGDQSTGGQISEGGFYNGTPIANNVTNRALGLLGTGTTGPTSFGLKLMNNSATSLSYINVHYVAELWRQQPGYQPLNFGYIIDPSGTATFTPSNATAYVTSLTASFQVSTQGLQILDGTLPANQTNMDGFNLPITNWAPGTALWLFWEDTNSVGSSQGVAVDNLAFSATANPLLAAAPALTLQSPAVLPGSVTLNATINPGLSDTAYYANYGTTTSYDSVSATNILAAGAFTLPVSVGISGLVAGLTYHYQLAASNATGVTLSSDATFVAPTNPVVVIMQPSATNQLGASLVATVNPGGATTTYYFQYGASAYDKATATNTLAAGATDVAVTNVISGLLPGTLYHVQVVASNGVAVASSADLTFTTPGLAAPTVVIKPATGITAVNATVNATVNPNGASTAYYFQYGTTISYGKTTVTNTLAAGGSAVTVTNRLSALSPGTIYHYQIVASNSVGISSSADLTFTNLAAAPTVATLGASGLKVTGATLNASVNPNGAATFWYFKYGPTTGYGSFTVTNSLSAGNSAVAVTNALAGLPQGTVYHYQIVATNGAGSSAGGDTNFTTQVVTSPRLVSSTLLGSGAFQFGFTNGSGASFTVLSTTNIGFGLNQWTVLGQAVETSPGQYQFADPSATNHPQQFYYLRQP